MKDNLDDFVSQNRNDFDDREPSEKVWKTIESSMSFSNNSSIWNSLIVWRAAAVIFMVLSVYLLLPERDSPKQKVALKEFADVEQFYFQEISEKTKLIQDFKRTEGLNGFTNDFKQLEAMYMVLKDEMEGSPSQQIKDALILNLLVRIDLLNQQLNKFEKDEYKEESTEEEEMKTPAKRV